MSPPFSDGPGRKERKVSFASTTDETLSDIASTRSEPDRPSVGSLDSVAPSFGSFTRAANYLMRRGSISKKRGSGIIEIEEFRTPTTSSSSHTGYSTDYGRIIDMFANELNRCSSPEEIAQLRWEREVGNPIICYESEDGDDEDDDVDDSPSMPAQAMESRAGDHSDFANRSEGSHQEVADTRNVVAQSSSLRELLGISSSMKFRCDASRVNYLPTSAHVAVVPRFPMEQQQ